MLTHNNARQCAPIPTQQPNSEEEPDVASIVQRSDGGHAFRRRSCLYPDPDSGIGATEVSQTGHLLSCKS